MNKIWILKFIGMMGAPQLGEVTLYFDNEEIPMQYFNSYTELLGQKQQEALRVFIAKDMYGSHVLRPDFYPYCRLIEGSASEVTFKLIDDSWKKFREKAGHINEMGFVNIPVEDK